MKIEVDFDTIDITALTYVPVLGVPSYMSLIEALVEEAPKKPTESVTRGLASLQAVHQQGKKALVGRLDSDVDTSLERKFDFLVDALFVAVRDQLGFWQLFEHEGIGLLSEDDREELNLDSCRELAEIAGDLQERMFGADAGGTDFLRMAYPQQAVHASSRLDLVEARGHTQVFEDKLLIPRAAKFLAICQRRYKAMVKERASREGGPVTDLRLLGPKMRRAIQLYSMQVAGMLDPEEPSSAEIVYKALLPNVLARPRRGGSGGGDGVGEEDGPAPDDGPVDAETPPPEDDEAPAEDEKIPAEDEKVPAEVE